MCLTSSPLITINLHCNGELINAVIDSGSTLNVVKESIANSIIRLQINRKLTTKMRDANGGQDRLTGMIMPLDSEPPPSLVGNTPPTKHFCLSMTPCRILLSDVGKCYHAFPKGTFRSRFTPPAVPRSVLRYLSTHPPSWSWTIKVGPNALPGFVRIYQNNMLLHFRSQQAQSRPKPPPSPKAPSGTTPPSLSPHV